jgi:hypothetical protein
MDRRDRAAMEIILDLLKFAVIFGVLATGPLVTWLAISWLFTDRRRASSRTEAS